MCGTYNVDATELVLATYYPNYWHAAATLAGFLLLWTATAPTVTELNARAATTPRPVELCHISRYATASME
ncbi:hypothetical protein C2857_000607 [Epichloe festucae Fl1]|uniref:Uncharacterized protein n=1 Tax=Epichloe festucae (strain Fl1) TaxID=877507 RepID=A0A7S9KJH3_EPIFF|nr:hypothetical protein C2857_000607 [Epichloe festucae Fl1]